MPTVHTYHPSRTYVGGLVSGIEPIDRGVVPAVSEQDTHVGAASAVSTTVPDDGINAPADHSAAQSKSQKTRRRRLNARQLKGKQQKHANSSPPGRVPHCSAIVSNKEAKRAIKIGEEEVLNRIKVDWLRWRAKDRTDRKGRQSRQRGQFNARMSRDLNWEPYQLFAKLLVAQLHPAVMAPIVEFMARSFDSDAMHAANEVILGMHHRHGNGEIDDFTNRAGMKSGRSNKDDRRVAQWLVESASAIAAQYQAVNYTIFFASDSPMMGRLVRDLVSAGVDGPLGIGLWMWL